MCVYPRVRRFLDTHKRREDREAIRKSWENTLTFPKTNTKKLNSKKNISIVDDCLSYIRVIEVCACRGTPVDRQSAYTVGNTVLQVTLVQPSLSSSRRNENFNLLKILLKDF